MPKKDIKVPNIGEFKDLEVIEIIVKKGQEIKKNDPLITCLLYTSPSPRDGLLSRMPSSA